MADSVTEILLRARMEVSGVEAGIGQIQKSLKGLTLPKGLSDELEKSFSKLTPLLKDYQKQLNKVSSGSFSKKDLQSFELIRSQVSETFNELRSQIGSINGQQVKLKVDAKEITSLEKKIETIGNNLKTQLANVFTKGVNSDSINKMMSDIANVAAKSKNIQFMSGNAKDLFNSQQYAAYNSELDKIKNKILSLDSVKPKFGKEFIKNFDEIKDKPEELKEAFDKFFNSLKVNDTKAQRIESLKQQLAELGTELDSKQLDAVTNALREIEQQANKTNDLGNAFNKVGDDINKAGSEVVRFQDELSQLQSSTQYFFSLRNMINLFRRGVQEAVETVKNLDAAMAKTAVVTEYSVSDMWAKLPEYTANAKKLGSTIQDMYEATTLYYQQGLNSEQAMGIAGETMKMARIGGLEAADATDKMTAALRGFHMELNEVSAQRINDVYSNLAAKTASDTAELGNAMQRTASIAANAGMSFEGTAAFLAQAIETTREPAENIGTAMKTIIARMQEMKKNPLEISEVDGEEVDYNKIDAALKSVGISLKAANGAFRDNDEVLLDIAQHWDTMSQTQQRYIATTIAGSRQQSRFIAMVGDYDRTMELMGYANNSAGASAEQFAKLEESLEFKTNKLKDTWQEFLMSIANEGAIKTFVSGADTVLTGVNKIIGALAQATGPAQGLTKSILSLGVAFMGLRTFGRVTNGLIRGFGGILDPSTSFGEQFKLGFSSSRNQLQAAAISNPIVGAIRQAVGDLIPHIDKSAAHPGNATGPGDLKTAQRELDKQLGTDSRKISKLGASNGKNTYTASGLFDIINNNQLTPKQQKQLFNKNPGLKKNLKKSLGKLLEDVGADKETKGALIKGFTSGEMPLEDIFKSPALRKTWGEQYQEIVEKYGSDGRSAAMKDLKRRAGTSRIEDLREGGVLHNASSDQYKEGVTSWLGQQQELSKSEQALQKMANHAQQLSGGMMAAGMAFNMVGSAIGETNEELGKVLTTIGSIVTTIGAVGMAFSTFMNMNPVLLGVSVAIGAIAGAATLIKKHFDDIRNAGKKVVETYKEINTSTQENISTLKSYQEQSEHWSKGVDEFGNNINLSDEEYAAYRDAVSKIAEINPGIVEGYNAQGQAIININDALKETIKLETQRQKKAQEEYTSIGSLDKLIRARNANKDYRGAYAVDRMTLSHLKGDTQWTALDNWLDDHIFQPFMNTDIGYNINKELLGSDFLKVSSTNKNYGVSLGPFESIIDNFNNEKWWNAKFFEKNGFDINFEALSDATNKGHAQAIRQFIDLQDQIYAAASAEEELSDSTVKSFTNLSEQSKAYKAGYQDVLNNLQTLVSTLPGYTELAPEMRQAISAGLEEIASDPELTGKGMVKQATALTEELNKLTKEGSAFSYIMESVTKEQDKFLENLSQEEYNENIKDELEDLDILMEKYADDTTAYGRAVYEYLKNQKAAIEGFTTSGAEILADGINEMAGVISEAEGAYEKFQEATKTDYSTGKNNMKSIYDEVFKTDDRGVKYHLEGKGDQTAWKAAEELLGRDYLIDNKIDSVKDLEKELKKLGPYLKEGEEGFANFWNAFMEIDDSKIDGLTIDKENNSYKIDDAKAEQVYKEIALQKGWSETFLISMLNAGRQYGSIDFTNEDTVRKALSTDESVLKGRDGVLITTNDYLNQALADAKITSPVEQEEWKEQHQENVGVVTVDNLSELSDKTIEGLGITDMRSAIETLGKTGLFDSEQIEEVAKKMPDYNPEDYQGAWQQFLDRESDPTLAPIESIESNVARIANDVKLKDIKEGNVNQSDLDEAKQYKEDVLGGSGVDTATQYFGQGKNEYGNVLSADEYRTSKTALEEGAKYAEQMRKAYEEAAKNAPDEKTKQIAKDAAEYYAQAEKSINNNLEANKRNFADAYAEDQRQKALEYYMKEEDVSLKEAEKKAEEVFNQAKKVAQDFIDNNGEGELNSEFNTGWKYGNVTQANRPQGLTDENGNQVTVMGTSASFGTQDGGEIEIAYTPVVTLDGKADILEDEAVQNYINALIAQLESEGKEVNLDNILELDASGQVEDFEGWKNIIADVGDTAAITAIQMHALEAGLDVTTINQQYQALSDIIKQVGDEADAAGAKGEKTTNGNLKSSTDVQATTYEVFTAGAEGDIDALTEKLDYLKTNYPEVYTNLVAEFPQYGELEEYSGEIEKLDNKEVQQTVTASIATEGSLTGLSTELTNLGDTNPTITVSCDEGSTPSQLAQLDSDAKKLNTTKTITVNVRKTGVSSITVDGHTWSISTAAKGKNNYGYFAPPLFGSAAKGYGQIGPKGKGGLTLTGELGYEIAWLPNENRSMILGANGPQMLDLPNNAVIWNHEQSKKILQQKAIPIGSMHSGSYTPSTGTSGGGSKKKKKKKNGSSSSGSSSSKSSTKENHFSIEEVIRFDYDKTLETLASKIKKTTDQIEKNLNKIGTRAKDISSIVKDQTKNLQATKDFNERLIRSYQRDLNALDKSKYMMTVSYDAGGKENKEYTFDAQGYVYQNSETGAYQIDENAIKKLGNKALEEAVYKAVEGALNPLVSGLLKVQDAAYDAQKQLQELGKKISEAFYQWDNELTEVYDLTQRIALATSFTDRFTSQIELELSKLSAGFGETAQAIENTRLVLTRSNLTIQEQIKNQQQMITARQRELEVALSYEDEENKLEKFIRQTDVDDATKAANIEWAQSLLSGAQLGSKYVKDVFKDLDGSIQYTIDWEQFNADNEANPYSKDTYEAIKKYLDDVNNAATEYNNSIKEQTDFIKQTYDALKEYQSFIADMEDTLIESYEKQIQTTIDNAKQLSESISNSLKNLLDEVKRKLDERRKQEDNAKTEQDISQKQQRLAALRANTAGGNQVEIAKLEKEIADAQQSYGRTLEDQLIDRLQQQGDEAAQQRERQIELAEAANEISAASHKELIDLWLKDPETYKEEIKAAWLEAQEYDEKGEAGQYVLNQGFESQFTQLMTAVEQSGFNNLEAPFTAIEGNTNTLVSLLQQLTQEQIGISDESSKAFGSVADVTYRNTGTFKNGSNSTSNMGGMTLVSSNPKRANSGITLGKDSYVTKSAEYDESGNIKSYGQVVDSNTGITYDFAYDKNTGKNIYLDSGEISGQNSLGGLNMNKSEDAIYVGQVFDIASQGAGQNQKYYVKSIAPVKGKNGYTVTYEYMSRGGGKYRWSDSFYGDQLTFSDNTLSGVSDYVNSRQILDVLNPADNKWYLLYKTLGGMNANEKDATYAVAGTGDANRLSQYSVSLKDLEWVSDETGNYFKFKKWVGVGQKFKSGGLNTSTGPAWLDGTPSKPELVLNAKDTQNFLALRDVLSNVMKSANTLSNSYGGDIMYDINIHVDKIEKDYDVDRVVDKVKKEITKGAGYRNVTQVRNFR